MTNPEDFFSPTPGIALDPPTNSPICTGTHIFWGGVCIRSAPFVYRSLKRKNGRVGKYAYNLVSVGIMLAYVTLIQNCSLVVYISPIGFEWSGSAHAQLQLRSSSVLLLCDLGGTKEPPKLHWSSDRMGLSSTTPHRSNIYHLSNN